MGLKKCKMAREIHDDETFIRNHLDQDLCIDLNLFNYSLQNGGLKYVVDDISDEEGWKRVKSSLINNVGLNAAPIVYVEGFSKKRNTLYIRHEHDGRDLELAYANKVYDNIKFLWNDDVIFSSIIEKEIWKF